MSEPKLISPLLDGFVLGTAMSDHDGVRCYPAMKENSDKKYIVKVISIPASQVQLEALLLTGAYKDPADAMDYFKSVSDGVIQEAQILQKLGKLEGFLSYDSWQVVPMEDGKLGYEVYLVGSYKRSLQKHMRRSHVTHLEAVNLGLDLCAALAICRRAGYIYVDLKPSNIYITRGKEYRIGDLGFAELNALKYTSLPGKYCSPYSPPEVKDLLHTLNDTVDTFAVGMILYQIYNEGSLPELPAELEAPIATPLNADYEMAEIIMKAIASDPKNRWRDPMEMGQALVAYMQRNSINDVPITPPAAEIIQPDVPVEQEEAPISEPIPEEPVPAAKSAPADADAEGAEATEEIGTIFDEADSIAAQEMHEEIVIPEPAEAPTPVSSVQAEESPSEPEDEDEDFRIAFEGDDSIEESEETDDEEDDIVIEEPPIKKERKRKSKKSGSVGWLISVILILFVILSALGGFWFYQNYYLQTINSITVDGTQNELTVTVDTKADHTLLTVVCTDTYGNTMSKDVENGQAVFTNLLPNSQYKIQLEISGFHKLVGQTADVFNTEAQTSIVSISAVTGTEDGSVMLTFTVDGGEPDEWTVTCTAEGEEPIMQTFTGHSVTVRGLTVGKPYLFRLSTDGKHDLLGNASLEYTPSRLVLAQNLSMEGYSASELIVRWNTPEDAVVESWQVRCYNDAGQEEIQEVTGNEAVFSGIDFTKSYTAEVTAAGMTHPARISITANPITITSFTVNDEDSSQLRVDWTYEGAAPEGGWLLLYSIDGSETTNVVKCDEPSGIITPRIHSANYTFTIQAADATSIFSSVHAYRSPNAEIMEFHGLSAEKITAHLLKTPNGNWTYESVGDAAFTDKFSSGDSISMVLRANANFYIPEDEITLLYVIRDSNGNIISELISQESGDWCDLWYDGDYHYAELNIPKVPTEAGKYSLSLYINSDAVTVITFSIVE